MKNICKLRNVNLSPLWPMGRTPECAKLDDIRSMGDRRYASLSRSGVCMRFFSFRRALFAFCVWSHVEFWQNNRGPAWQRHGRLSYRDICARSSVECVSGRKTTGCKSRIGFPWRKSSEIVAVSWLPRVRYGFVHRFCVITASRDLTSFARAHRRRLLWG